MSILFSRVTLVTMDPQRPIVPQAYVLVEGDEITWVDTVPPEAASVERRVEGEGRVLMPGLVNAHTHLPMALMRGYGGGCDLQHWLQDYIFPAEARLDGQAVRIGTTLALCELMASGVTCVGDMYYFCQDIAQAVAQSGMKANLSRSLVSFQQERPEEMTSWQEMEELYQQWNGYDGGRIQVDASVHGEYTSFANPALWEQLGNWAVDRGCGVQVHISETWEEHQDCIRRHGKTPIQLLEDWGLWRSRGVAAHCVWVTPEDMDHMARQGIFAVHNPVSNLKLASGIAKVPELLRAGVKVALGTDGVASNNSHDLWEEIKLAALLHKGTTRDPQTVTPWQALEMATLQGNLALGRKGGVVAVGRPADLILLDMTRPGLLPCHDLLEHLVFSVRGGDVVMNMCGGRIIYEEGEFLTLDLEKLYRDLEQTALPQMFPEKSASEMIWGAAGKSGRS